MKNTIFNNEKFYACFALIMISITLPLYSQDNEPAFKKGSKTIGFAAGFGVEYGYYSGYRTLPAFTVIYDQGFFEDVGPGTIGIGGMVGVKTAHFNYATGGYKSKWNNYIIGVRGTYHLTILKDKNNSFDPYAGIMLGIRIYRYKDTYYDSFGNNPYSYRNLYFVQGAFIGAKYNFTNNFGVFAEAGYDISLARVGLNINF
jgi:hypothetical protein